MTEPVEYGEDWTETEKWVFDQVWLGKMRNHEELFQAPFDDSY